MQMIFPAADETGGTTPRRMNSRTASRAQRNCPVRFTNAFWPARTGLVLINVELSAWLSASAGEIWGGLIGNAQAAARFKPGQVPATRCQRTGKTAPNPAT